MFSPSITSFIFSYGFFGAVALLILYGFFKMYQNSPKELQKRFLIESLVLFSIFIMISYDLMQPFTEPCLAQLYDWFKIIIKALFWTFLVVAGKRSYQKLPDNMKQKFTDQYVISFGILCLLEYSNKFESGIAIKGPLNYVSLFVFTGIGVVLGNSLYLKIAEWKNR